MTRLSAEQRERFRRDGALSPIPVLQPSAVLRFRAALARMEALLGGELQRIDNVHLHLRWARELASDPGVIDVLEDLLGPDVLVHSTRVFAKQPRDGTYVKWHQDGLYSHLGSDAVVTAWIALTDSRPDNGCVRVIPGSHRDGPLAHREAPAELNLNHHGEEVAVDVDESAAADFVLAPGEMSLHDVNIVHSSYPNHSDRCRIGFSVTYVTPAVHAVPAPILRARGDAPLPHLRIWSDEPPDTISEGLAAHVAWAQGHGHRPPRMRARLSP